MKESQEKMLPHSEVKVELLKNYLEAYLNIITKSGFFPIINIYDMFCGEGVYDNGGKGSPIVILETIKNIFYANNKSVKFNCLFNDIDNKKTEKLHREINERKLHYSEIGDLVISNIDYQKLLPKIATKINSYTNQKAFIFIDPYGYKDINISDIKTLLKSKKSEVLLFLPTQFMFRFDSKGTPECLINFIEELMPKEKWPLSSNGIVFIENLTETFRNSLGANYFVDSFIITRDTNQFFCLFFFTSHIYGFDRMLHEKWRIDEEQGRGWKYEATDSLFTHLQKKPDTIRFERKLHELLKNREVTNGELYEFTLQNGHLPKHTTEILTKLQLEGKLSSANKDGTQARQKAFYLSYENYNKNPDKIKLKLK
jgi:three-Cys-motif partner protein